MRPPILKQGSPFRAVPVNDPASDSTIDSGTIGVEARAARILRLLFCVTIAPAPPPGLEVKAHLAVNANRPVK